MKQEVFTFMEIWKDVPGFNGNYQASTLGRVKSFKYTKPRILKQSIASHGYYTVTLWNKTGKTYLVHVLIAMTFLNHKPNGMELVVDHIDGGLTNNNINNLQIITHSQNINKGHRKTGIGSSKYPGVSWNKQMKKWRSEITINQKHIFLGLFNCEEEANQVRCDYVKNN